VVHPVLSDVLMASMITQALILKPASLRACKARTLELAAAVLGDGDESILRSSRGSRVIHPRERLAAVPLLGEREAHLSAVQRLALALMLPRGGFRSLTAVKSLHMHCLR
jgi:hypothetical protein